MRETGIAEIIRPRVRFAGSIEAVYLTCFRSEFSLLATVLHYSAIRLHRAETLDEADFLLTVAGATVLLTDTRFLDGSHQNAMRMASAAHPLVVSLLAADPADRPLLADAYQRGACGVLWKPIDFGKAIALIRTADQAARDRESMFSAFGAADMAPA